MQSLNGFGSGLIGPGTLNQQMTPQVWRAPTVVVVPPPATIPADPTET
jgi:hypothetical protein